MKPVAVAVVLLALCCGVEARIQTKDVEYRLGDDVFVGYLAYDDGVTGKRPGVLVIHEWMGLGAYEQGRAQELAALGYVAFAGDVYGKGVRPKDQKEAGALAGGLKADRALLRQRAKAALDALKGDEHVDPNHLAAIGYCFGGTTVLELARSGAQIAGVVSFHGGLDTPAPDDAKNIKCRVLVCHGGDDPHVPMKDVMAFEDEMRKAGVDWQVNVYGGAVHSFSNPAAGNDVSKGAAYNEKADKRSWEAMKGFLGDLFK